MLSKNKIKFINTLKKKKTRNEKGLFLAEGEKIVLEIIHSTLIIENLIATEKFIHQLTDNQKLKIKEIIIVNDNELKKISNLKTPNEALAVVKQVSPTFSLSIIQKSLSLALDTINDPGNLGTIIRIADWFGIKEVICSENSVDLYNPKTIQATMGAISRVNVHYKNIAHLASELKNNTECPVYGCFLEGNNIYETSLKKNGLIILGSESHGISEEIAKQIDTKLFIPSFSNNPSSTSESLNVSIAAGIVCSEFRRR
jgi:TrmH family RNA methyltransferase